MTQTPSEPLSLILEHLRALMAATGPSGSEEDVGRLIVQAARPHADSVRVDALGNVIAVRRAAVEGARTCLISAHMDEVGFRVLKIEPGGFLRLEKVGGLDDRILPAQRLWVRTAAGHLGGVIGTKSAHLLTDADRAGFPAARDVYVDIGARDAAQARAMGVEVGDPAGFVGELTELGQGSGRFTAHAVDDRAGCAVLLALLEAGVPDVNLVAVFSVQEEIGLRGATAVARATHADLGPVDVVLALDMTAADDTPDTGSGHLRLGAGPAVKVMDASTVTHPAVRRGLLAAAGRRGIPVQHELLRGIGTDAGALQYLGGGVPTGAVSVANRYTHSAVEVVDAADLQGAYALLRGFLEDLPGLDLRFVALADD